MAKQTKTLEFQFLGGTQPHFGEEASHFSIIRDVEVNPDWPGLGELFILTLEQAVDLRDRLTSLYPLKDK